LGPRISKMHWGQGFQKCSQNLRTLIQRPCMHKKIAKMCAKYMLCIDLHVFGVHFKNATKTFIHLPRAHAHAKKNFKMCAKYMLCIAHAHAKKKFKNVCKIHVVYRFICFWSPFYLQTLKKLSALSSVISNV